MPSLTIPLIASAIAAAVAFGAAWTAQDWRYSSRIDKMVAGYADARLDAEIEARGVEKVLSTKVIEAQNAATKRNLERQAADAITRTQLNELRDANAAAWLFSTNSPAACNQYAATANPILNECAAEVEGLEKKASGHASDVKTLIDAWPRNGAAP